MTKRICETVTKYLKPIYAFALKGARALRRSGFLRRISLYAWPEPVREGRYFFLPTSFMDAAHNRAEQLLPQEKKKRAHVFRRIRRGLCRSFAASDESIEESVVWQHGSTSRRRLRLEIKYLSKLQRKTVVAFYYEIKS